MQATASTTSKRDERELRDARFAMRLSLILGLAMLLGKTTVYFMTHSAAIFSGRCRVGCPRHRRGICYFQSSAEHKVSLSTISVRLRANHFFLGWI